MDFYRQIMGLFPHAQENHEEGVGIATALGALLGHPMRHDPNAGLGSALAATFGRPQPSGAASPPPQAEVQAPAQQPPAGLSSLVDRFRSVGLENVAQSWVGNGPNQPISPEELHRALGPEQVQNMAAQSGMPANQLLPLLAQYLPAIVDKLTPHGRL
jgi:uncharacterized protein YidB (DUF937 family)